MSEKKAKLYPLLLTDEEIHKMEIIAAIQKMSISAFLSQLVREKLEGYDATEILKHLGMNE